MCMHICACIFMQYFPIEQHAPETKVLNVYNPHVYEFVTFFFDYKVRVSMCVWGGDVSWVFLQNHNLI